MALGEWVFKNAPSSSIVGIAPAQPGRDTTIAAQAEPLRTESLRLKPSAIEASNPAIKLSPAPTGLIAAVG